MSTDQNKFFINENSQISDKVSLDMSNLPEHIAIIMDGNGRWAQKRKLPRTAGHKAGIETIREIIRTCSDLKIKYLTLYAFSTENWQRPEGEISALMQLLVYYLRKEINELHKNNVRIHTIGDISKLPQAVIEEIQSALKLTQHNNGLFVNIALNYGGRDEIVRAVKILCEKVKEGELDVSQIDEKVFEQYLYTKGIPSPDLLIRPSGELRISNFLLWQMAYTEFWFSNIYWPDFTKEHLIQAICDYQKRERRFGGVK